jgi:hypothetical protein
VLDRILGLLLGGEHVATEPEDPGAVAIVDRLESSVVPTADVLDQAVVRQRRQKAP